MDQFPQTLIGTVLSGRYRIESKLGSGGMSTVYLAEDVTLARPVAVKVLHREISGEPEQLERFRRESKSAARMSHPNLVGVIDAGEDGGTPYIVFEYVEGETLKQRIERVGPLPVDEAVAYAIEIGRGLAAAHARRLVHRDVKPQNVLIDTDGRARVTDFGIARSLETHDLTGTGNVIGTTDYLSPEQAMGDEVDERTDVYSLGIVLYEMLTADVPYSAETQVGVAMMHVNTPMPDVLELRPDASAAVAAIVDRATAKDPEYRYWSIAEMLDDLEGSLEVEAARGGGTSGEATNVLRSVPKPRRALAGRRRRWKAGLAMAAIGVGLIAGALILGGRGGFGGTSGGNEVKLSPSAATAFDPLGDDEENSDEVKLAIDGNPTGTAWATENYDTAELGGVKTGVGIYVDAGDPVKLSAVEVRSKEGGWDLEVRSAPGLNDPPAEDADWETIGRATDVGSRERVPVRGAASRFYLIWITKLAPAEGRYRVEITDIRLLE